MDAVPSPTSIFDLDVITGFVKHCYDQRIPEVQASLLLQTAFDNEIERAQPGFREALTRAAVEAATSA
jgi:hypothetical protein